MELRDAIARVCGGKDLDEAEMAATMGRIMDGEATQAQIGALLVALRMKGEAVSEIVGAARAMRHRAVSVRVPEGVLVDTCGTGGDGAATINVSTIAAFVVAACGVRVAKHGNRAVSSRAGSADVLEALGVDLAASTEVVERCLVEVGIGFFFAPAFHGATRHAGAARREIGVRTLFNLLGPITNPAGARHQVIGVYDASLVVPIAETLGRLGSRRALVVHGHGGLDEISPSGPTQYAELHDDGRVTRGVLTPADFHLTDLDARGLAGGDAEYNAAVARAILDGEKGAARQAVVLSAAAALHIAGAGSLPDAARSAEAALDDGRARAVLDRLVEATRPR